MSAQADLLLDLLTTWTDVGDRLLRQGTGLTWLLDLLTTWTDVSDRLLRQGTG